MKSMNPHRLQEQLAEKHFDWTLPMMLLRNGILCDLIKVKETKTKSVYGHYSGQQIEDEPITTLLCAGLPIEQFRNSGSGQYGQGFFKDSEMVYADYYSGLEDTPITELCPSIEEGDVLRIHETDAQFIITNVSGVGPNNRIQRFNISSILSGIRPDQHSYPEKLVIKG